MAHVLLKNHMSQIKFIRPMLIKIALRVQERIQFGEKDSIRKVNSVSD